MDKFEVLNRKLDIMFNEIMDIRERFEKLLYDREIDELEKKAKLANDEVRWRQEDKRYLCERFNEIHRTYGEASEEYWRIKRKEETEIL